MYAPNGGPFSGLHKVGVSLALYMHLMEGLFLAFIRQVSVCIIYAPNEGPFSGLQKAGVSLALCMHLMEGLFLASIRQVSVLHCVCT